MHICGSEASFLWLAALAVTQGGLTDLVYVKPLSGVG